MKTSVKDILESIPDFEDFMKLADEIGELSFRRLNLDRLIKASEAFIVRRATSSQEYFIGGRPPSMQYIESTFKHTGFNDELLEIRKELAEVTSELDKKKIQLSIYRDMLEIFRTLSANERSVVI